MLVACAKDKRKYRRAGSAELKIRGWALTQYMGAYVNQTNNGGGRLPGVGAYRKINIL